MNLSLLTANFKICGPDSHPCEVTWTYPMGKRQMEATAICFSCNFPWLQDYVRSRSTTASAAPETSEGEPAPAAEAWHRQR